MIVEGGGDGEGERGGVEVIPPMKVIGSLLVVLVISLSFAGLTLLDVSAQPVWPQSWIEIDWDKNENGLVDDWRDVRYAYYQYDSNYLYLKLQCYSTPGMGWPSQDGRYKWFIDPDGNMYFSGGNIYDAEYLLFVEDADQDGAGELYLVSDTNDDNNFGEYEPWPPMNYGDYQITDPNIGGWRITASEQIEMYVNWASLGTPLSYTLFWATDQQNPNLDQGPTTDHVDEEEGIAVHNVAAVSQVPTPTEVNQGENVTIQVSVENTGTQTATFNVTCYFNNTLLSTELVTDLAAGTQAPVTFNWDTTGLPAGNYSITAWADSSAGIAETDEADNWCTSLAIVTVHPQPLHDVAAVSQVPDKTNVMNGTVVNINVTVSNLGDFVETFNVTCYYGSNPIGYQTVTNLAAKSSTSLVFAWNTTGVTANTYYILAMADSNNLITEIDETNNNCTSIQTVTVFAGTQGKLFVDKVQKAVISGDDPPVVSLPTVYELKILVSNVGGSAVSNIEVNETISPLVTFVSNGIPTQGSVTIPTLPPPDLVWDVGTLDPGANATLTFRISLIPTSHGLIYLNHKEDIVASGIETYSGTPIMATGQTDTTVNAVMRDVAAISQVPSDTIVPQGESVAVEVTVKNFGNLSETFDVTGYYDNISIGVVRVYNLGAGEEVTIPFEWVTTSIPPGTYTITALADSSDEIAESDETNNLCTSPAAVEIVIHDIAIISQVPSQSQVTQGDSVLIEVVVKNEGTETATFTVSCYYNETFLETKTVTNLAPDATTTVSFIWGTTSNPVGTYYINTAASPVPGEKDTDDNACRSTTLVRVNSPPQPVGGSSVSIRSPFTSTLPTWISLNTVLIAFVFVIAFWRRRHKEKIPKQAA